MRVFLKKWMKYFVFAGFFSLFINMLNLTFPIYMLSIYDRVLASYSMPTLITITVVALFALMTFGLLDFLRSRLLVMVGVDMDRSLSRPVLAAMLKDASSLQKSGYSQGLRDVNVLRNYFAGSAVFAFFDTPWVPIYLAIIYFLHPLMGMVATAGAIVTIVLGICQEILTRKRLQQANMVNGQAQGFINASLRNSEAVRSMGMLSGVVDHWQRKNDEVIKLQTVASRHAGSIQSLMKTVSMSMQVIIYGTGAYLTLHNECTAGIMISSSIIMGRALGPINQAMATWRQTVDARGSYNRLDALVKAIRPDSPMELPDPDGKLDVEGATLVISGRYILRNITFSLQPGEIMGLIGPSAAGKTSLCRVLLGIWPSMGGKVRLCGADVFQWDQEHLGKFVGYLPQDVELFTGTISENIARLGEVDSEKVIEAAKKAGVHDLILHLPNGYDTGIGEAGQILSGGQRQRVGLARALYDNPKLVVLDEPNSNLDDAGEKALMQTLDQLKKEGTTTIVVSHKPTLLANVDKVLMMKAGQVAMFGPRQDVFRALMEGGQPAPPSAANVRQIITK